MSRRDPAGVDWAFQASDGAVMKALAEGGHAQSLREYFGTGAYRELCELARAVRELRRPRGSKVGPKVLILPGIMGSRLCDTRPGEAKGRARAAARILWIDPARIASGSLKDLMLPSPKTIRPAGVLLFSYAKLKLELELEGFRAAFFPYDWRLGVDELGTALAARIAARREPVTLIAHSMGGLIARVAAKRLASRYLDKLIMLGTPNRGSFAPVQALRGTYPFVRKLSRLDHRHSPEFLAQKVFGTFPGLYHMLPPRAGSAEVDLLDPGGWPRDGFVPDAALLGQVAGVRSNFAEPDERMTHIVGVNRETVVGVRRTARGFEYGSSLNGDGTVPVRLAVIPKLRTYFIDEWHGNLANNSRVIRAILDLLHHGKTRVLPRRFVPFRAALTHIDDEGLRRGAVGKIDWRQLNSAEREAALQDLDGFPVLP